MLSTMNYSTMITTYYMAEAFTWRHVTSPEAGYLSGTIVPIDMGVTA